MELTQDVKDKITAKKLPQLSEDEPAYTVEPKRAKERGLRSTLRFEDGKSLGIMQLNKVG